jgi:hypothetical protein
LHTLVSDLWDEWAAFPSNGEDADSAEISGLVAALPFKKNESEGTAILESSRLWALRRLAKLWKSSRWRDGLNAAAAIRVPFGMKGRVEFVLPWKIYKEITVPAGRWKWAWARGVWGGCGALYVPKSGYYLVMRIGTEAVARSMEQILSRMPVPWGSRPKHGKSEITLRNQQGIVAFLSKIGLTSVSLRVEDKAILRAMRDQANRVRNCDTANIKKALKAAEEQTELAMKLRGEGALSALPDRFRVLVEARLEHPEESLSDLGKRLSPPVTKSTVKYRWKRLRESLGETSPGNDKLQQ